MAVGSWRRIFGGDKSVVPKAPPPARPTYYSDPTGKQPIVYTNITCPHCGVRLHPLPRAGRKCKACGNMVEMVLGEFGIATLVRSPGVEQLEYRDEEWEARKEYGAQMPVRPGRLQSARRAQLQRAAALGLFLTIEVNDADSDCSACLALKGQRFAAREAPVLPLDGCRASYLCDCRYVFELPQARPVADLEAGEPRG